MLREDITAPIISTFYEVFHDVGHGFVESVYERCMVVGLRRRGFLAERQKRLIVRYYGIVVGRFKADLIVENAVMVELKACRSFDPAHEAQLLNYLNACTIEVGLLLLFAPKPKVRRLILTNDRKPERRSGGWSVASYPETEHATARLEHRPSAR
jgi:GxxExxY protein